jgi:hypothetical protein
MGIILTVKDLNLLNVALIDEAGQQEKFLKKMRVMDDLPVRLRELQARLNKYVQNCRYLGMSDEEIFLTSAQIPEHTWKFLDRNPDVLQKFKAQGG